MPRPNDDVERVLMEFADLLSILTDDPYKPRSYEKAARAVGGYHADVSQLDMKGILGIPSVGKSIGEKIAEILSSGTFADLEELRAQIPAGVRELMSIPGLGPKKAIVLYRELGVASVPELVAAIEEDRVAGLKGFGGKTQDNILRGLEQLSTSGGRVLVSTALDVAEALLAELSNLKQVRCAAYAGSLRRMRGTIGDVDADVGHGRPRGDVPVDPPHVVARLVRPNLGELRATAQVVRPVLPGDEAADASADGDVERAQERLRRRTRSGLRLRSAAGQRCERHADSSAAVSCGAGTAGTIRSRIMSGLTSSASALKLGTIRWRRTSRASSVTSDGRT